MKEIIGLIAAIVGVFGIIIACLAAWVTHVIWWVGLAMNEQLDTGGEIVLAVVGTLFAPIGVIHGFMLWF